MPALPVVPSVLRIDLQQTDNSGLLLGSRLFWKYTGGAPSNADCASLAASIRTAMDTNFEPMIATVDFESEVKVTDLSSASGGVGISTGTGTGTRTGNSLPAGVAAVCSHLIARRYRGGKCRTYFQWGTATDVQTQNTWTSSFLTAANSAYAAFTTALNGLTAGSTVLANQVNVSYYHGFTVVTSPTTGRARNVPTPRATPLVDNVSGSAFALKFGSQRRRYGR